MKKVLVVAILALLTGCADRDKSGRLVDGTTYGEITIAADEALKPLVDAEIKAFEGIYHNARIKVIYTSEVEAIDLMLADSARLAIVTRRLEENEEKSLTSKVITPKHFVIAKDGIALIVHPQISDTEMKLEEVRQILTGDLDAVNKSRARGMAFSEVVFDQPNSGMIRYLRDSIVQFDSLPKYCFAVNTNAAVVDYVSKKPQALGLIDVSWISDGDDSTANSFLKSIRVMKISGDSGSFQPYQAYLATRKYPLARDVVIISREARSGLGTGFIQFCTSDKGQRIVLKSGLVPSTMPIRIVEINHEPF